MRGGPRTGREELLSGRGGQGGRLAPSLRRGSGSSCRRTPARTPALSGRFLPPPAGSPTPPCPAGALSTLWLGRPVALVTRPSPRVCRAALGPGLFAGSTPGPPTCRLGPGSRKVRCRAGAPAPDLHLTPGPPPPGPEVAAAAPWLTAARGPWGPGGQAAPWARMPRQTKPGLLGLRGSICHEGTSPAGTALSCEDRLPKAAPGPAP